MKKNISKVDDLIMYHNQLGGFSKLLDGANYSVGIGLHAFILHNSENFFSIDLLKEMYEGFLGISVDGKIEPRLFISIQDEINKYFNIPGNSYNDEDMESPLARTMVFWNIIERSIGGVSPDKCYSYVGLNGTSLFSDGSEIWDFSFILIRENKGIVLLGSAGD